DCANTEGERSPIGATMTVERTAMVLLVVAISCGPCLGTARAAQDPEPSREVAFVANAEAGTVALVDVVSRTVLGAIDVNPARAKSEGPGAPNYAQDTDVSPDGRTLYVSRGYLGDVAAFDIVSGRMLWRQSLDTGRADHMTLTPDGRSLFVSALMDN